MHYLDPQMVISEVLAQYEDSNLGSDAARKVIAKAIHVRLYEESVKAFLRDMSEDECCGGNEGCCDDECHCSDPDNMNVN